MEDIKKPLPPLCSLFSRILQARETLKDEPDVQVREQILSDSLAHTLRIIERLSIVASSSIQLFSTFVVTADKVKAGTSTAADRTNYDQCLKMLSELQTAFDEELIFARIHADASVTCFSENAGLPNDPKAIVSYCDKYIRAFQSGTNSKLN